MQQRRKRISITHEMAWACSEANVGESGIIVLRLGIDNNNNRSFSKSSIPTSLILTSLDRTISLSFVCYTRLNVQFLCSSGYGSFYSSFLLLYGLAFFNLFFRWSIWIWALFNCAHRPVSPRGKAKGKRCSGFLCELAPLSRMNVGNSSMFCYVLFEPFLLYTKIYASPLPAKPSHATKHP